MGEAEIVAQLRQNITPDPEPVVVAAPPLVNTDTGQAKPPVSYDLDDMTQYKLHDFFGEQYQPTNEVSKQKVQYIYDQVSKMVEEKEYGFIVAKIRDLELILGITQESNRLHRLHQWLKLDQIRKGVDAEMDAITHG